MLCLASKNLTTIPQSKQESPQSIKHLDVSINQLQKGIQFRPYTNIMTLIIDENQFRTLVDFPVLKQLETFSANKNLFASVNEFALHAGEKFPKLKNLATLRNPMNPYNDSEEKYIVYKKTISSKLPSLKTLDGLNLTGQSTTMQGHLQNQQYDEKKYQRIIGVISFDQKYAEQAVKSVKTRSEGNRFLKNNHL